MAFTIHTFDEMLTLGLSAVSNTMDKSENAMIWDAVAAGAVMAHELEVFAKRAFDLMDIENNFGKDLDRFVYQRAGIERRVGTKAQGVAQFTGDAGTVIPKGFGITDGRVEFLTEIEGVIGDDGKVLLPIVCSKYGDFGPCQPNTLTDQLKVLNGIKTVTNPAYISAGYDTDTDEKLRWRYYDYLRNKATSNNPAHYRMWANEVPGVGQVRVYRAGPTPLSVKVVVLDNRFKAAPPDLVEAVRQHIEEKQSFDVDHLEVVSATVVPLNIAVSLELEKGYTDEKVKKIIKKNIDDFLSQSVDRNFERRVISFYDIASVIIRTEGVLDIKALTLNGAADNIQLSDYEVAEIGDVT